MDIPWHQFTGSDKSLPITQTGLTEKASVIGRTGLMMLSCGTGAWRVRSSMNSLATLLGVTCTADIGDHLHCRYRSDVDRIYLL